MVAALIVATNGPVFLLAKSVLDRRGHWEDPAVWPFFAAAAVTPAAMLALDRASRPPAPRTVAEWAAIAAVTWYSLAAVASTAWSVDRSETAWRAAVYLGLALLAWVMSGLGDGEIRSVLTAVTAVAVVASVALVVLRPDLGLDSAGRWQGVYTNRNSLAPLAAIGLLVGLRHAFASARSRQIAGGALTGTGCDPPTRSARGRQVAGGALTALSLAAMIGAGSRTAWLALCAATAAAAVPMAHHWLLRRSGRRRARALPAAGALAVIAGGCITLWALWDVDTFSQRRTIWALVWDKVQQRPLLGHGFFTFWDVNELTDHVLLRRGSAHSSLMEVALGLGLLGTVPFAVIVALAARNAGLRAWRHPSGDTWLWAAVVAFVLVENLTESFVLWFSYNWVLVMAAALRPPSPRTAAAGAGSADETAPHGT